MSSQPVKRLEESVARGRAACLGRTPLGVGHQDAPDDLDLLWTGEASDAELLADAFWKLEATLTDDDGVALACAGLALRVPKILFRTGTASDDCCTPHLPWGRLPIGEYMATARVTEAADGTLIRYVSLDALQDMRLAVGRTKDLRRVAELQAIGYQD